MDTVRYELVPLHAQGWDATRLVPPYDGQMYQTGCRYWRTGS
jgi:hypothetical protein